MKKFTIMTMTLCLCASTALFAVDGTWNNAAGGAWETAGNWVGNNIADGASATATFTDNSTISVDASRTIGVFRTDGVPGFWVTDGPLILDGGTPVVDVTGGDITMNCALSGSSGFNKTGAGMLKIYNTFISGDINVNGGIFGLMWADSILYADVIANNAGTYLGIHNGVDANGKSVTVNNGALLTAFNFDAPGTPATASLNAPLTCNHPEANTFAVDLLYPDAVLSLNSNITLTADTGFSTDANGCILNVNAPISGPHYLKLMGRSATTSIGTFNINAPCTYTGFTYLNSWAANPIVKIGANQAFPCGAGATELQVNVMNSTADTSVTLDLNDKIQRVNILTLNIDGAQTGHSVEITGTDSGLLIITNKFVMGPDGGAPNGAHARLTGGKLLVETGSEYTWIHNPIIISNATMLLNAPWYGGASTLVEVQDGGIVGGDASGNQNYGALTVKDGGKVSPGNSIGTLNTGGDVTMESGSEYDWEVDLNSADLVYVAGDLDVSGGITVNVIDAGSPDGNTLTLFTAAGTITGAGIDITMSYGAGVDGPVNPTIVGNNIVADIVPEPATLGLLSLLALAFLRRK